MEIYFTIEASQEVINKIDIINKHENELMLFFKHRSYSPDLEFLYIGLFCMSPNFESFFLPQKPIYTPITKTYIHKGVEVEKKAKTYEFELRLNFEIYNALIDIRQQLAKNIVDSLDNILSSKKIKNLDIDRFKNDFQSYFRSIGWL